MSGSPHFFIFFFENDVRFSALFLDSQIKKITLLGSSTTSLNKCYFVVLHFSLYGLDIII